MTKRCLVCEESVVETALTCPNCGEASWDEVPEAPPVTQPELPAEPVA